MKSPATTGEKSRCASLTDSRSKSRGEGLTLLYILPAEVLIIWVFEPLFAQLLVAEVET
jgi:hypothetical protein